MFKKKVSYRKSQDFFANSVQREGIIPDFGFNFSYKRDVNISPYLDNTCDSFRRKTNAKLKFLTLILKFFPLKIKKYLSKNKKKLSNQKVLIQILNSGPHITKISK